MPVFPTVTSFYLSVLFCIQRQTVNCPRSRMYPEAGERNVGIRRSSGYYLIYPEIFRQIPDCTLSTCTVNANFGKGEYSFMAQCGHQDGGNRAVCMRLLFIIPQTGFSGSIHNAYGGVVMKIENIQFGPVPGRQEAGRRKNANGKAPEEAEFSYGLKKNGAYKQQINTYGLSRHSACRKTAVRQRGKKKIPFQAYI